jgi:hypothetical protein
LNGSLPSCHESPDRGYVVGNSEVDQEIAKFRVGGDWTGVNSSGSRVATTGDLFGLKHLMNRNIMKTGSV